MAKYAVGIDLGTTTSCVSIFRGNSTDIIKVNGERIIDSTIYYDIKTGKPVVGKVADRQSGKYTKGVSGYKNLIIDSKRFIGRHFDDPVVQEIYRNYNFRIERNNGNEIKFIIKKEDKDESISPERASSEILLYLKKAICTYFSLELNAEIEAVITVPAYFSIFQRQATLKAAELAGIKVLKLLNEPTAAALKYFYTTKKSKVHLLVFDFGGGTLDITIIHIVNENNFIVLATEGDSYLGGRNIDDNVFNYLMETYKHELDNINERLIKRLQTESEKIKVDLSQESETASEVLSDYGIEAIITRKLFDEKNFEIYNKCIKTIEKCMKHIKGNIKIDEILLVGGSSLIPTLEDFIIRKFPGSHIIKSEDRSEVVSSGAAIQAALIKKQIKDNYDISDVLNISIGYESFGEEMNFILNKNAKIPCSVDHEAVTIYNNQKKINLNIYEGERKWVRYNRYLGSLAITDIPPHPAGTVVKISFNIDISGNLEVRTKFNNKVNIIKMTVNTNNIPNSMICLETDDHEELDKRFTTFVLIKTAVTYCCQHYINQSTVPDTIKNSIRQLDRETNSIKFDAKVTESVLVNNIKEKAKTINYQQFSDQLERNLQKAFK